MKGCSPERRQQVIAHLRDHEHFLLPLTPQARELNTVALLICDDQGYVTHSDLTTAYGDPLRPPGRPHDPRQGGTVMAGRRARLHVQLAVDYHEDDRIIEAGEKAELLYVRCIAFCKRRDEFDVTYGQVGRLAAGLTDVDRSAERLVLVGLWQQTPRGYRVLDPFTRRPGRPAIPRRLRARVMDRDGHQCVLCRARTNLTLDHIWPWSLGGEDTLDNLRVLCRPCNSRKGARV